MTNHNLFRTITTGIIALSAVLSLTACGSYDAPGELGENQQILTSCPAGKRLSTFVQWDGTASNFSQETDEQRLRTVRALAQRTAVCGGHFTVSVFSTSSGSTVTVYDGEFNLPGATDNARLRRVPEAVEAVDVAVRDRYARAIASLPTGGTDINGIYRLAGEQQAQLGEGYQLVFVILSDGMNNLGGITLDGAALTPEEGSALADQVSVPHLPGAEITVAGLGRVAEGSAPSNVVAGLVAYYDRLCARAGAATCLSVTDWR